MTTTERLKNHNGTVHVARNGAAACGPLRTHRSWLRPTVEDVTCKRCREMFACDDHGLTDPVYVNPHIARREAERAVRMAARG